MADKTYELTFALSDGSEKKVQFTAPEGPQGETGPAGPAGPAGGVGEAGKDGNDGVGIVSISIAEV